MSVIQPQPEEGLDTKDVQIWNNAAFDNGDFSEDSSAIRPSWSSLKSVLMNSNESFSSKENQNPQWDSNSSVSSITEPFKPINPNRIFENSKTKANLKQGISKKVVLKCPDPRDEKEIDKEIEEVEMEISRLSSRLEALRIEKVEKNVKTVERRGRIVPAKFMDPKQSSKNVEEKKKIEESAKTRAQRRGLSVGPVEILSVSRRGMSLGPSEIVSGVKSRQLTPFRPIQDRRKSCFMKLQDIDEEKLMSIPKTQIPRQAVTTIGSKKTVKKDDWVVNSVQPKRLFKDPSNKKPLKQGRAISSRYNQSLNQTSVMRKRSLPENDESNRVDKKRSLSFEKPSITLPEKINESREKKRWEIPNEIIIHGDFEAQKSPLMVSKLPRLKIAGCSKESPRDSGPAKRVADLVGRKSFFSIDEEVEAATVCQALSFVEEEEIEE